MSVRYEETIHYIGKEGEVREADTLYEVRNGVKVFIKVKGLTRRCLCGESPEENP